MSDKDLIIRQVENGWIVEELDPVEELQWIYVYRSKEDVYAHVQRYLGIGLTVVV